VFRLDNVLSFDCLFRLFYKIFLGIKMNDFENMLYEEIKDEILSWDEGGIYAISFFLESNELITYR
jgi:hypothetical protein